MAHSPTPHASLTEPQRMNIHPIVRPRSVAIVGLSSKPGSAGHVLLGNLLRGGFEGEVHLVGRSGGVVDGRTVLTDVAQLPEGIDLAILMVPSVVCVHDFTAPS